MDQPVALKTMERTKFDLRFVKISDMLAGKMGLTGSKPGPAILLTHAAVDVPDSSITLVDEADLSAVYDGNPSEAILLIVPQQISDGVENLAADETNDVRFIDDVKKAAPDLAPLAEKIIKKIRQKGVDGYLLKNSSGRWVNRPINSFTLKVQPRAKNIQFTIYGNPWTFDDEDFLKRDQNSYSRGSVNSDSEIDRFVSLVATSHSRKLK